MTEKYLFRGESVSFEETFPEIEDIEIKGTEGDIAQNRNISLGKNLSISCSNPICKKGGYHPKLGDFIMDMYRNKEVSKDGLISCKGYENMGRGNTRSCLNHTHIKVNVKYKTPSP